MKNKYFYIIIALFLSAKMNGYCNSTTSSKIDYGERPYCGIQFFNRNTANFSIVEQFSFTCWAMLIVKNNKIDIRHTSIFFKINNQYSAIHMPNAAHKIFIVDNDGIEKELMPAYCFIISNVSDGGESYLYLLNNNSITQHEKINIYEFTYNTYGVLEKDMYLCTCLFKCGLIYDYFQNYYSNWFMRGFSMKKSNYALPHPPNNIMLNEL